MTISVPGVRSWRINPVSLALLIGVALTVAFATYSEARGRHHHGHHGHHRHAINSITAARDTLISAAAISRDRAVAI